MQRFCTCPSMTLLAKWVLLANPSGTAAQLVRERCSIHVGLPCQCENLRQANAGSTVPYDMAQDSLEEKLALAPKYGQNQAWLLLNSVLAEDDTGKLFNLDVWLPM